MIGPCVVKCHLFSENTSLAAVFCFSSTSSGNNKFFQTGDSGDGERGRGLDLGNCEGPKQVTTASRLSMWWFLVGLCPILDRTERPPLWSIETLRSETVGSQFRRFLVPCACKSGHCTDQSISHLGCLRLSEPVLSAQLLPQAPSDVVTALRNTRPPSSKRRPAISQVTAPLVIGRERRRHSRTSLFWTTHPQSVMAREAAQNSSSSSSV